MLRSLWSRILIGMLFVVIFTAISTFYFVHKEVHRELFNAHHQNAVNLLNSVYLNVENSYKSIIFHKKNNLNNRTEQLVNISNIAIKIVQNYYRRFSKNLISELEAKQQAIKEIKDIRYDNDVGYLWINDITKPVPKMIMHPTLPDLDGKILDDPVFNCALGKNSNLFSAAVDVCLKDGAGFIDYLWPKPTEKGLTEKQPKISYVNLFKEWGWVVGTGVYIDDIEKEEQKRLSAVLRELKDSFSRITFAESGYMFIFNGMQKILIHPNLEGADGSELINPATGTPLFSEMIAAEKTAKTYDYIWNKPQFIDEFRFPKRAYIRYFKPLDWYIVSTVYIDEINQPAENLKNKLLVLSFILVAIAICLSLIITQSITTPIRKLMKAVSSIKEKGIGKNNIPVSGTIETKQLGTILDETITSLQKSEAQLRQAQKMETVGTLAGGLAHDFNNVLTGVTGLISLINYKLKKNNYIDSAELEKYLENMNKCTLRASNMVQQLLTLSKKQEMNFELIDLNEIIADICNICNTTFKKSVLIKTDLSPTPTIVSADSNQLSQIILNLCINAEHAMTIMRPENSKWGGDLVISTELFFSDRFFCHSHPEANETEYYILSIKDNGVGMDIKTIANIFNPFFTTKKQGEGTGLGLSMAYNIIKQHKGFIDVYSEPGIGSTFNIYLPAYKDVEGESSKPENKTRSYSGEGLILIVDDEEILRETAKEILTSCGYKVLLANNGLEAVEIFEQMHESISAVLMDMAMPVMSGKTAFLKMKKIDPAVKVVLSSGFRQDERINDVLNEGVKEFLSKPYTMENLTKAICRVMDSNCC